MSMFKYTALSVAVMPLRSMCATSAAISPSAIPSARHAGTFTVGVVDALTIEQDSYGRSSTNGPLYTLVALSVRAVAFRVTVRLNLKGLQRALSQIACH